MQNMGEGCGSDTIHYTLFTIHYSLYTIHYSLLTSHFLRPSGTQKLH